MRPWIRSLAGAATFALALVTSAAAQPATYAVDFVSTAATGRAMNEQGQVAGERYTLPPGCTPHTCLGVREAVVWSGDDVIPLPRLPGFPTVTPVGINASGWVAGYAGDPLGTGARAVVWKPVGGAYVAIDLGVLPGTSSSWSAGIDDLGRAVGWSTTGGAIPTRTAPFVWTEATGLVDLAAQGFPNEPPLDISPGGTVATPGFWYRLGDPASVAPLAPPPPGFTGPGNFPAAINDAGDQARFLLATTSSFPPYLFRYDRAGVWQQIDFLPAGRLAPYGIGSINEQGDITATVRGVGLIAYGPDGLAEPLAGRLSPAYTAHADPWTSMVPVGGPITDNGRILAEVMIGRSPRLVRLVPAEACTSGCVRVAAIDMTGRMIGFPRGQCTATATNSVTATVTVTGDGGRGERQAAVTARFLDDYYLDEPVTGTTGLGGRVRFVHRGPACVGAIALLVEDVRKPRLRLDRTTGELVDAVIPQP
jgi:hypothetical protein